MAVAEAKAAKEFGATSTTDVFETGKYAVTSVDVETSSSSSPPKPLLIYTPTAEGEYPVAMFFHGFYLRNYFYSNLLQHIASHGYIVVAPQLYTYLPPTGLEEINYAAKVANWLPTNLQSLLPESVSANLDSFSLIGHSRGGKVAFSLALGYGSPTVTFSLLIGIDPVAGVSKLCQTEPHILTYVDQSFKIDIPITVIGTGLGPEKRNLLTPPCAPEGVNHEEFFKESKPPCAHFVAADYGHMDMLDDDLSGLVGEISECICKNGTGEKELMRRACGGIVVAFFEAYLGKDNADFLAIVEDPSVAPIKLDEVEFIEA